MAVAIRDFDWSSTSLGPIASWPSILKTSISLALSSKFPKCIVWGSELISIPNDAFLPLLGDKPSALGRSFKDVWEEAWDAIGPIMNRTFAGEAIFIEDFPLMIHRHGYPERACFTFCYSPIRDDQGRVRGILDTVIETTSKVDAERRFRLLNRELIHRSKNMLTVVSAIVSQTMRGPQSKEECGKILLQRINALGEVQSLLAGPTPDSAEIRAVIEAALKPFRGEHARFVLDGPNLSLYSKKAQSLVLAINELATNAIKYGALSSRTGSVSITWKGGRISSNDPFSLSWVEFGGPPVEPPPRKGFGTLIIEEAVAREFDGSAETQYLHDGLRYELRTTMARLEDNEADAE